MINRFRIPVMLLMILVSALYIFFQFFPLKAAGARFFTLESPEGGSGTSPVSDFSSVTSIPDNLGSSLGSPLPESSSGTAHEGRNRSSPEDFESISSVDEWNEWAALVNSGQLETDGYTYELSENLDFSSEPNSLLPVGTLEHPFSGDFDGKGFRIIGIDGIQRNGSMTAAPFGYTSGANITALGVETSGEGLHGAQYAAGVVGIALKQTSISACYFTGTASGKISGGLVAEVRGKLRITDCYAIVSHRMRKGQDRSAPEDSHGVLIGLNVNAENDIRVENAYGLSPNQSVETLFGSGSNQERLTTKAVYLFDIHHPDLLTQIDEENLEGFDFYTIWKQPNHYAFPLLKWQDSQGPVNPQYTYCYGDTAPVAVSDTDETIHINTGQREVMITATCWQEGMRLYSNLASDEKQDGYILEMPATDISYTASFIGIEHGQASVSQLYFSRVDDNAIHGTVRGLDAGTHYTVSLQSTEDQSILSETFLYSGWSYENYVMSGIPEGTYHINIAAKGYHPVERSDVHIDSVDDKILDAEFYKVIETVQITGLVGKRVDLDSRNHFELVVTPEDADVSYRETEVWLEGKIAGEQDYHLSWSGNDSFVFIPNVSGAFVIRIGLYDMRDGKYVDEVAVHAYREIQNIVLPRTVDITAMDNPIELTARILPADATDTNLDWILTSGRDNISLAREGNVCRVYPQKVGVSTVSVKSVNGIERTVRIRVLDKIPPVFGEAVFENITAVDRVMVSFPVEDDCGIAQVTVATKSGGPVSVSKLAAEINGYAFEGALETEYVITATDINGNSETMSAMTAELLQAGTGNVVNSTNSGLAVSKSDSSVSLWVSANELEVANYHWQKKTKNGEWISVSKDISKLEDSGLLANTWYEYRMEIWDEAGNAVTRTSAVRTNPTPIQSEDIEILAGGSYDSIYVGETFPVRAVISNQADVTGQSHSWNYDKDAMVPETPGDSVFVAKRAGTYPLEYSQTDTFGRTVKVVKMVEILSFDMPEQVNDSHMMLILQPMLVSVLALGLLAFLRARMEKAKLK